VAASVEGVRERLRSITRIREWVILSCVHIQKGGSSKVILQSPILGGTLGSYR
jgi:hypothetical protein